MEKKEFEDEGFQAGYLLAMILENRKCEIGCNSVCQNCIDKALQQAEEIISENKQ